LRADGLHTSSAYQEIGKGAAKGGKATSRQNTEPNAATKDMNINQGKIDMSKLIDGRRRTYQLHICIISRHKPCSMH
jgi:hypothetical protein